MCFRLGVVGVVKVNELFVGAGVFKLSLFMRFVMCFVSGVIVVVVVVFVVLFLCVLVVYLL